MVVPLPALSELNVYRVLPLDAATTAFPIDVVADVTTTLAMRVGTVADGIGGAVRGGVVALLCGGVAGSAVDVAVGVGAVLMTGDGDAVATEVAARLVLSAAVADPQPARVRSAVAAVIRRMLWRMSVLCVELRTLSPRSRGHAQRPKVLRRARSARVALCASRQSSRRRNARIVSATTATIQAAAQAR
jgi:hypothetical protein